MNAQEIPLPPQTLSEVYRTIAQRHEIDPAKLPKDKIEEDEFMAALAYNKGSPLVESGDLTEEMVSMCQQSSRELDPKGMAEYKFVPMTIRGQTLLVISSCPWDPMMVDVISGYFPQCSQVRFAIASPRTLEHLLAKLQGEAPAPVAGYAPAQPVAPSRPLMPPAPPSPAPPAPSAPPKAPLPPPPTPKCSPPSKPAEAAKQATAAEDGLLSPEDATYLANLWLQEANRLVARKSITKP